MPTTDLVVCRVCQQPKPANTFEVCRRIGDRVYRRKMCSACKVVAQRSRRAQLRVWLEGYKKTLVCVRCGFSDFRALHFHHRDDEGKDFNVGDMARVGYSIEAIKAEIAKCDVLCANCHNIEHYDEMAAARAGD